MHIQARESHPVGVDVADDCEDGRDGVLAYTSATRTGVAMLAAAQHGAECSSTPPGSSSRTTAVTGTNAVSERTMSVSIESPCAWATERVGPRFGRPSVNDVLGIRGRTVRGDGANGCGGLRAEQSKAVDRSRARSRFTSPPSKWPKRLSQPPSR